jgi:N-acetylglucosamine-6-sulfatase
MLKRGSLLVLVAVLSLLAVPVGGGGGALPATAQVATPPNIVLILTDDQRWDTLWAMPNVQSLLVDEGASFSNSFVVNPLCCPSRASILTGKYSRHNGVYGNPGQGPFGGFAAFTDTSTIATSLDAAGYRTGIVGKYLNGYDATTGYVAPGWDRWVVGDSQFYYDYQLSVDGVLETHGSTPADYSTTVETAYAEDFIRTTDPADPLFLYFAPKAPHSPYDPAPGDENTFDDLLPWRPPSWNEADVSDKPAYIQARPSFGVDRTAKVDKQRHDQYQALLGVDRAVATIVDALADTGRLSDTMIVFASDNGMLWGEHRWYDKHVPYEESIRVPMVIRYDPVTTTKRTIKKLALNIDWAPTWGDLAGVTVSGADGTSLMPLLRKQPVTWRNKFTVEHISSALSTTYCALRTTKFKLIEHETGELELYDLVNDPYELDNLASLPAWQTKVTNLRTSLHVQCDPPPPGMTWGP